MVIPNGVKRIGENSFCGCEALTNITIPDSVESIGSYSFENCKSLKNIFIPAGVKSMGTCLFNGVNKLFTIYCEAKEKPAQWKDWWNNEKYPVVWACSRDKFMEMTNK
jgi:hypothetical protein